MKKRYLHTVNTILSLIIIGLGFGSCAATKQLRRENQQLREEIEQKEAENSALRNELGNREAEIQGLRGRIKELSTPKVIYGPPASF